MGHFAYSLVIIIDCTEYCSLNTSSYRSNSSKSQQICWEILHPCNWYWCSNQCFLGFALYSIWSIHFVYVRRVKNQQYRKKVINTSIHVKLLILECRTTGQLKLFHNRKKIMFHTNIVTFYYRDHSNFLSIYKQVWEPKSDTLFKHTNPSAGFHFSLLIHLFFWNPWI